MKQPIRLKTALLVSILASLIAAPVLTVIGQWVFAQPHPVEVFAGALVTVAFFGISVLIVMGFGNRSSLKKTLIWSYLAKIVLLAVVGILVTKISMDNASFGLGIGTAAAAYLLVQVLFLSRRQGLRD